MTDIHKEYEESRLRWALVVQEPLFRFLKHDPAGRRIVNLLADGQISHGKFAEAVTEKFCLNIDPQLPEWEDSGHEPILPTAVQRLEKKIGAGLRLFTLVGYAIGFLMGMGTAFLILKWHK